MIGQCEYDVVFQFLVFFGESTSVIRLDKALFRSWKKTEYYFLCEILI